MTVAGGWGAEAGYHEVSGRYVESPPRSVAAAEAALAGSPAASAPLIVHPGDPVDGTLEVRTEDGRTLVVAGTVGPDVPLGYHVADGPEGQRPLVVSPRRCHLPAGLRGAGWAVQLASARSAASWGIGDLADLRRFGAWAAGRGAGFALISPLNAAAMVAPIEPSPYLPTSRRWRNPLHLRVEEVPGAAAIGAELDQAAAAGRALNERRLIDRDAVAALKLGALRRIAAAAPPPPAFLRWRAEQGDDLERFAAFCVIAERHGADFREWPHELRDPGAAAVTALRHREATELSFHAWLQWLLEEQLGAAAAALPVMADLPIGVHPGGADVWADQALFARDFSVGAPPDDFNTLGQDWAQPPWNPLELRARAYQPLAAVLRAGFRHAMGLRIDHVMGLFRLFWIPRGEDPRSGVYVRYPAGEMLDILALESARAGGVVVGEDLGTVEPGVREEMAARDILSYRLLYFSDGPVAGFPCRALSAVTTHDLPTVAGLWSGADSEECRAIGVPVNEAGVAELRGRLAAAAGGADDSAAVAVAAYAALAASPSMLVAAALEDAAGATERPNIPGTTTALRPNWSLALPAPFEEVLASPLAAAVAAALRRSPG